VKSFTLKCQTASHTAQNASGEIDMKMNIDTDKITSWLMSHLVWVIPAGLSFASWACARFATDASFIGIWYGLVSLAFAVGAGATLIIAICRAYDRINRQR
jgi:hypothetical protein